MNARVVQLIASVLACAWLCACQFITGLDGFDVDAGMHAASSSLEAGVTACPALSSGACDLVAQCGCEPGWHCQDRGTGPACFAGGSRAAGAACSADADCGEGTGCLDGLCKRYCTSDSECEGGLCRPSTLHAAAASTQRACLTRCDFAADACQDGARCAQLRESSPVPFAADGSFCVAPLRECATDQRCDEPAWGTRLCEAGSDAADCRCESSVPDAACDLISQCGCAPGLHCALGSVDGARVSLRCVADRAEPKKLGELCSDEAECGPGHSCWRGLCEKYCRTDADCGGSSCIALTNPEVVVGVRVCTIACSFESERECAPGSRCVHAPDGHDYCFIPRTPCPYANDGTCDEASGGSRICADGTDTGDCP